MQTGRMKELTEPRVIEAERAASGVLITFNDGSCALYSAGLLRDVFGMAEEIPDDLPDEE